MNSIFEFFTNRLKDRLWTKPLAMALLSIAVVSLAHIADGAGLGEILPDMAGASLTRLLEILTSSMLVVATFAVASMVAAYASAANTATPRSFVLMVSDDVSQRALSRFIGAFIFGVLAHIALENGYYGVAGTFVLFVVTIGVFVIVIITFIRWVDSIARLGRMGNTLDKVEEAARNALERRRLAPGLGGVVPAELTRAGQAVHANEVGYVRRIDVDALQRFAADKGARIFVDVLPGAFLYPRRPVAWLVLDEGGHEAIDSAPIVDAFVVGVSRNYDSDPRFGIIVLSEIASRAMSPAVNDPGTAIDVVGRLLRLFARWAEPLGDEEKLDFGSDRVAVRALSVDDMFEDAFNAIARDSARNVEVMLRLQKTLGSLALLGDPGMREAAVRHARWALERGEEALKLPADVERLQEASRFIRMV